MFSKCLFLLFCFTIIDAQYPYSYRKKCPWPHVDNGRVRVRQRNKLVKFMCLPQYELVGDRYANCNTRGEWDVPMPVCVRPGCPPSTVENAVQVRAHHNAWVTTFCLPGYTLIGSATIYCNGLRWNTTIPRCVVANSKATIQLSCNFEEPDICGWLQDDQHDFDWTRLNSRTPTSFLKTGPAYDHTLGMGGKGYYMYIESTSKLENSSARLLSPVYDSKYSVDGCFSLFYHMYGQGIGGLRVYQKPDNIQLSDLLDYAHEKRQQYVLFEQWGNQGDFWYSAAPQLKDFKESFQIVIEGIRGTSFTSDIAIDDVAILQGDNCTNFRNEATTPVPPENAESCAGRCDEPLPANGCGCTITCFERSSCCQDYMEACIYSGANSSSALDDVSPTDDQPQTEKLVSETTTSTTPATTTSTTTTTTTTTVAPTTKLTSTTKLTTKPTPATTQSTTTTMKSKPTRYQPTTKLTTKPSTKLTTTTQKVVYVNVTKLTTKPTVTKMSTVTTVATKNVTIPVNKEDKKKGEKEIDVQKMTTDKLVTKTSSSSSWKTAIIVIVALAALAGAAYLGLVARTNSGRVALARLRGRVRSGSDPEVRYLNSNDDDL